MVSTVKEAYANLFDYIITDIFPGKKIVLVTSLTMKLESFMLSGGVELLRDSTRKHIHRTLKSELGDSVHLFPDDKGKLLMVPESVSLQDVVLENQSLRMLEQWACRLLPQAIDTEDLSYISMFNSRWAHAKGQDQVNTLKVDTVTLLRGTQMQ
jgi:hypothetical protein